MIAGGWELHGAGHKTGPAHCSLRRTSKQVSTVTGSPTRRLGTGGGCPSPFHSLPFVQTVFWGRGQNYYWSLNLAAAFYSTLPRINCPNASSTTKKGNCRNPHGQPLPSHQRPPSPALVGLGSPLWRMPCGEGGGSLC